MDDTRTITAEPGADRVEAPSPTYLEIRAGTGEPLFRIHPDGRVEAPSIEAASEAGRVFVESIRHYLGATV